MRCRRICRELLWLARFGEFGPSSAPHLDHLSHCGNCRDEVGFDRALVQQLRTALAARIAEEEPSASVWDAILERAQAPDRGFRAFVDRHAAGFVLRVRTATAVTAMALAGIIATSTHVAITHPEAGSAETEVMPSAAGELYERQALVPRPRTTGTVSPPVTYVASAAPADPEAAFLVSATPASPGSLVQASDASGAVTESGIRSVVNLGTHPSRQSPLDPVADGRRSDGGGSTAAPPTDTSAGEPF